MVTRALLLLSLLGSSAALGACSGLGELSFDVSKPIPSATISGTISACQITNPIGLGAVSAPFQMTFSQAQDFPQQNTNIGHIDSVKLKSLSLSLASTSPQTDWSFLTELDLYVQSANNPLALVASVGLTSPSGVAIPAGTPVLSLVPAGLELAPYVKDQGGFQMTSQAKGCPPSQNADYSGQSDFGVQASPL